MGVALFSSLMLKISMEEEMLGNNPELEGSDAGSEGSDSVPVEIKMKLQLNPLSVMD
jgi:hypothetical protein